MIKIMGFGAGFFVSLYAFFCVSTPAFAGNLSSDPNFSYEVRFTNPECEEYAYDRRIKSVSGDWLSAKPKNVYCTSGDAEASAARPESVEYLLKEWIDDSNLEELFFAYLTFSNKRVKENLCDAAKNRGVRIEFVLDSGADESTTQTAQSLVDCAPDKITWHKRGGEGGLGYAHNKLMIFNPQSTDTLKIIYSSGNLTSGTATHHENWHFVTASASTHFMQAHLCLMDGMINHGRSKVQYRSSVEACRAAIESKEESDIQVYLSPAEGAKAGERLIGEIKRSESIWIAAHRFSYKKMLTALNGRLKSLGTSKESAVKDVRIVMDDDTYWVGTTHESVGPNTFEEYQNAMGLVEQGASIKFMQTNHPGRQLHHNKFMIFDDSVFAGAGNLTGAGFERNFENFYWIGIPSVVKAFKKQYKHMWGNLATAPEDMPAKDVQP